MSEKENSATRRVLKSVVSPMLKTSIAAVFVAASFGCEARPEIEKVGKVAPTPKPIQVVGQVPASTPGSTPTSQGSANPNPTSTPTPKPDIEPVGKVAPTSEPIHKVGTVPKPGKVAPIKVGKVAPTPKPIHKVGKVAPTNTADPFNRSEERPTRLHRRTTDESGSVLRTGFVGGRKLT